MPINTALMHQRFSTPKIQVSPRERVMWRLFSLRVCNRRPIAMGTAEAFERRLPVIGSCICKRCRSISASYHWNLTSGSDSRVMWYLRDVLYNSSTSSAQEKNYIYIINNYFENNYNHFNIILFQKTFFFFFFTKGDNWMNIQNMEHKKRISEV